MIAAVLALVVVIANQLKVETQRDGVLCCLVLSSPVLCSVRQALWHGSNQCTNSLGRPTNQETKLRTFVVNRLTPYRLRWCAPSSHTIPLLSLVRMSAHTDSLQRAQRRSLFRSTCDVFSGCLVVATISSPGISTGKHWNGYICK